MLARDLDAERVGRRLDGGQFNLHDIAGLVFELHRKVVPAQHRRGQFDRAEQLPGGDAMIGVLADPGLKKAGPAPAKRPAAIDEIALHPPDLGDMEMRLDRLAVSPDDGERPVRMGGQGGAQLGNL